MNNIIGRIKKFYWATAIVVLTSMVLLAIINVLLFGVFYIKDKAVAVDGPKRPKDNRTLFNSDGSPADNGKRSEYELTSFDYGAYGNIPEEYAADVLDDFYSLSRLGFIYQPWVAFSEPPFAGKRVHVDRDIRGFPIRRTINPGNQSNGPVINLFVFGGSTTFGYFVSDEHTWSSYLSQILNKNSSVSVRVTNYGHSYFNPSQEAFLFADLLKSGHRPSLAVFMDGINPPRAIDVPTFSEELAEGYRRLQFPPSYSEQFAWIPIVRLESFIARRLFGKVTADATLEVDTKTHIKTAVNGFRQDRDITKAVATLYGVPTLFFLQPNSVYNYDAHLFRSGPWKEFEKDRALMTDIYEQLKNDPAYIDLSGLFADYGNRKAVLDDCHYSPSFSEFLAKRVAEFINTDRLERREMAEPTGGVRIQ